MTMSHAQGHPREGFVARCEGCGAPVGIVLGAAIAPCGSCGSASPLGERSRDRLLAAGRTVSRAAARENHRLLAARNALETSLVLMVMMVGATWLVMGSLAFYLCVDTITDHTTVFDALTNAEAAKPVLEATWILALLLTGLALGVSTSLFSLARARAKVAPPLALPPLSGGAYRCYLCGAALGGSGAVRACTCCGASNLVAPSALKAHVQDLFAHIEELDRSATRAFDASDESSFKAALLASLTPILIAPIGGVVAAWVTGTWYPVLNYPWVALFAVSPLPLLYLLVKGGIGVRRFEKTAIGDEVRFRGAALRVVGLLHLPEPKRKGLPPTPLRLLAPAGSTEPTVAAFVEGVGVGWHGAAFTVLAGGRPLDPTTLRAPPEPMSVMWAGARRDGATWVEGEGGEPSRVFAAASPASPAQGQPVWTLQPLPIKQLDVFVP